MNGSLSKEAINNLMELYEIEKNDDCTIKIEYPNGESRQFIGSLKCHSIFKRKKKGNKYKPFKVRKTPYCLMEFISKVDNRKDD